MKYYQLSFVGRRTNNQDSCVAVRIDSNTWFYAVADGMGGTVGGEVASEVVIKKALSILKRTFEKNAAIDDLKAVLKEIYLQAQAVIKEEVEKDSSLAGMGTTLCCVLVHKDNYVFGNIGDSRIYLLKDGSLDQITKDHSLLQEYRDEHDDEPPENLVKQYGHIITRSLNGGTDEPDIYPEDNEFARLGKGELFLLCSDGLIVNKGNHDESDILNIILAERNLENAAKNLISNAFFLGSSDNITVVLANSEKIKHKKVLTPKYDYPPQEGDQPLNVKSLSQTKTRTRKFPIKLYIAIIIFLAAIVIGAYYLISINLTNYHPPDESSQGHTIDPVADTTVLHDKKEFKAFAGFKKLDYTGYNLKTDGDILIEWIPYDEPELELFKIIIDGSDREINIPITETNIKLNDLAIKKPGDYSLIIYAVLKSGQEIKGKTPLNLRLK